MRLVPVGKMTSMCRLQEEYGGRGALLLRGYCKLYLCSWPSARAQSAPKRRLGVAVATPLQRRRDRWTAIALRRVHRQHTSSDTSTGSIKSLRVLPIAQLAETTEGPIATLSSWDSMNNFCSPTTSPKTIPAIPTTAHVTAPLSTLDYAHVTAATAVEPAKSAVRLSV